MGDQEFNVIDSVKNMTKYAVMVTNPQEIAYHLEKALFMATNGRGGPVWLDIPLDVQGAKVETENLIHFNAAQEVVWRTPDVKQSAIDILLQKIKDAKAPLVIMSECRELSACVLEILLSRIAIFSSALDAA